MSLTEEELKELRDLEEQAKKVPEDFEATERGPEVIRKKLREKARENEAENR